MSLMQIYAGGELFDKCKEKNILDLMRFSAVEEIRI